MKRVEMPELPDQDSTFDKFAELVTAHPDYVVVGMIVIALMLFWKKPIFRGIIVGLLAAWIVAVIIING